MNMTPRPAAKRGVLKSLGTMGALLLGWALALGAVPGHGWAAESVELAVPNAASTVLDRVPPVAGKVTGPGKTNAGSVRLTFQGADDGDGSGLKSLTLMVKKGSQGVWEPAGTLVPPTAAGEFSYSGLTTEGSYYFALRAEDLAGNASPAPTGTGDAQVVVDRVAPQLKLVGPELVEVEVGTTYVDAGATALDNADGDITSRVIVQNTVDTSRPGTYLVVYNVSDEAGNAATPIQRTVRVTQWYQLTIQPPALGTLKASPVSANGKYAAGTSVVLTYAADSSRGADVAQWTGATPEGTGASQARVVMDANKTVSVTLRRHTGSVAVKVTPEKATWTLTDGDGKTTPGSGSKTLMGVPAGSVSITFDPVTGMTTPPKREAILAKDGTVTLQGTYTSDTTVALSLPSNRTAAPGATVDLPLQATGGPGITQFKVDVTFDPAVVEWVSASAGSLLSGWSAPQTQVGAGKTTLSGTGPATGATNGTLLTVRLRVKSTAKPGAVTPLGLANAVMNDGTFAVSVESGDLTVAHPGYLWGDANGDGLTGDADASIILQHRVGLVDSLGSRADAANVSGESPAVIGTLDASYILAREAGVTAPFPADVDGDGYGPESDGARVSSPQFDATPRSARMPSVWKLDAGVELAVPIVLDNAGHVRGYLAQVEYDANLLEFLSVGPGGLTKDWTAPVVNAAAGTIRFAAAGSDPATGGGTLAVLAFRARQTADAGSPTVRLASIELNDGAIPCAVQAPGESPTILSVSPARGAEYGTTVVVIEGTNLAATTDVRFGNQSAPWFEADEEGRTLTALTPAGTGTVDVQVITADGTTDLAKAFTYFAPDVYLTLDPPFEVNAGSTVDVPVWLDTTGSTVSSVTFELRYDDELFAARRSGGPLVTVGNAASSAKKNVQAKVVAPGRIQVTVSGNPNSGMSPGLVCTVHLVALGDTVDSTGLIYVTDISAQSRAAKSLTTDAGTKRR